MIGIGAPCIDFVGRVEEEALELLPGRKGDSVLVNVEQLGKVLSALPSEGVRMLTGGCCANTVKGLASLGERVSFCGKIGTDFYSEYFLSVFRQQDIKFHFRLSEQPIQQVVVLVTPDGQRTCYYFLGAAGELAPSDLCCEDFMQNRLAFIEGYSLHRPGVVRQAIAYAKEAKVEVAIGLNSKTVVETFRAEIVHLIESSVDIVFCNQEEARVLTGGSPSESAEYISKFCKIAVITIGRDGCWVGSRGKANLYKGCPQTVVDTTGAGDLFVSGFLHGYLNHRPLSTCADWGNLAGGAVIGSLGAEIAPEGWEKLRTQMR